MMPVWKGNSNTKRSFTIPPPPKNKIIIIIIIKTTKTNKTRKKKKTKRKTKQKLRKVIFFFSQVFERLVYSFIVFLAKKEFKNSTQSHIITLIGYGIEHYWS